MTDTAGEDRAILEQFPLLRDSDVAYLDNAATTQKPERVLRAMDHYYRTENANPLRGLYKLSVDATDAYEGSRREVADLIGADPEETIFTRNATEGLNLVAYAYGLNCLHKGDRIVTTVVEHHSDMLPWQMVAERTGAKIDYIRPEADGTFTDEAVEAAMGPDVKLVAMTQASNVTGIVNDVGSFARIAHEHGAVFVCDGAQSVPHMPVDVKKLDVDFLAFSGHKMYGPMGIGALYGKREILDGMPPFLRGGEMIEKVTLDGATWGELPHKFEAGTVNAGGAVGMAEGVRFMKDLGFETIERRERDLVRAMMDGIRDTPGVSVFGPDDPDKHNGVVTFAIDGVHPHDVAAYFDSRNVCVRAGHHCAQPLMGFLGVHSTTRASVGVYNTMRDVERFLDALRDVRREMGL